MSKSPVPFLNIYMSVEIRAVEPLDGILDGARIVVGDSGYQENTRSL